MAVPLTLAAYINSLSSLILYSSLTILSCCLAPNLAPEQGKNHFKPMPSKIQACRMRKVQDVDVEDGAVFGILSQ